MHINVFPSHSKTVPPPSLGLINTMWLMSVCHETQTSHTEWLAPPTGSDSLHSLASDHDWKSGGGWELMG